MKNDILILTTLLVVFLNISSAAAGDRILSVQSIDIAPYQEALKGFQSICSTGIERIVLSEMKDKDIIKEISRENPSIILSIGVDALDKVKDIDDIPVIYIMIPYPQKLGTNAVNFTGVRMNIKQEDQLSLFLKAVPSIKTIGLIYDPEKTGHHAQRAVEACKNAGVNLIAEEIGDSREAPSVINSMEGKIDGFWMLPDVTAFTPETIEYLFLFSMKNKVPILTFSEIYLESGALVSIDVDPFDMGSQAGEMALEILSGKSASDIQPVDARREVISINMKISEKLGISIDKNAFSRAKFFE